MNSKNVKCIRYHKVIVVDRHVNVEAASHIANI